MPWSAGFLLGVFLVISVPLLVVESVGVFAIARERGTQPNSWFYHVEDGYHYHISFSRGESVYFKCIKYPRCGGRAVFDPVDGFEHTIPHRDDNSCRRDIHYPAECELRRKILARCERLDYATNQRIIDEESNGYHIEVRSRFTENRMRTSMRNARRANYPYAPQTLRGLTRILLNPAYRAITMTQDGLDNLYAGSATDTLGAHHVVFITHRMIEEMRQFTILQCDGTFKTTPAGLQIAQVFCIVGVKNHKIIPLMWALMETRTTAAYLSVLELIQNQLGDNINLRRFIMDFEQAEMNAVEATFNCRIQGCSWHAIRRFLSYVADRGLLRPMRLIEAVRRIIRLTMALPLLPEHLIRRGMVLIVQEAQEEGNYIYAMVRPYLQDVYRIWIRSERRIRRLCVFGSSQRTNNACECHNRCLREAVGVHPNIFTFINGLIRLEQRAWDDLYRIGHNRRVGRARAARSIMNDERLTELGNNLLQNRGNADRRIMEFMRNAGHLMDGAINEAMM